MIGQGIIGEWTMKCFWDGVFRVLMEKSIYFYIFFEDFSIFFAELYVESWKIVAKLKKTVHI